MSTAPSDVVGCSHYIEACHQLSPHFVHFSRVIGTGPIHAVSVKVNEIVNVVLKFINDLLVVLELCHEVGDSSTVANPSAISP